MRIIYGCNSQGQGHLSKAATLVPLLERRGHDVRVISSGPQPPSIYQFRWHRHLPGLPYSLQQGRTDYLGTMKLWLRGIPGYVTGLTELKRIVQEFQPELIISDFEPMTGSPALKPGCEVVSMCRQAALLDPQLRFPDEEVFQCRIARAIIRLFTMGADRMYGFHYEGGSHRCLPPVIREDLWSYPLISGKHIFIYNYHPTATANAQHLIAWSERTGIPVRAYGYPGEISRGLHGNVLFQPSDRVEMMKDMASCRAAIVTAGLTTPLESFLMQKPTMVIPLEQQWEQLTNAWHMEHAGIARMSHIWDYDAALEIPPPGTDHPAFQWLTTSPQRILDAVLMEPSQPERKLHREVAA
ncbi:glycosyltransferase family protein [Planctomicrobium sp. SH664]|uniref:glycosyltransferase family protein n=1 Tax=Planctomicrobium sp. SH664 TaxID=3448125 RepID=UPI003F5CAF0C